MKKIIFGSILLFSINIYGMNCSKIFQLLRFNQDYKKVKNIKNLEDIKFLQTEPDTEIIKKFYYFWRFENEVKELSLKRRHYLNNVIIATHNAKYVLSRYKQIRKFDEFLRQQHILVFKGLGQEKTYQGYLDGNYAHVYNPPGEFIWDDLRFYTPDSRLGISLSTKDMKMPNLAKKISKTFILDISYNKLPYNQVENMYVNQWDEEKTAVYMHRYASFYDAQYTYLPKMKNLFNQALSSQSIEGMLFKLAHYFQVFINSHLFPRGNMSVVMSQINGLLLFKNFNPIPHRNLDYLAMLNNTEDFAKNFLEVFYEFN